jgi:hypothetical protein
LTPKPPSMNRKRAGLLFFFVLVMIFPGVRAQSCSHFPADCPSDRQLPDSADRLGNAAIPEEISMEIRLRDFLSGLLQEVADKKGWEFYIYEESNSSGFLNADRTGPLPFEFRPPHSYDLSFIIIVDQDSLRAWKQWDQNFAADIVEESKKMIANNDYSGLPKIQAMQKDVTGRYRDCVQLRVGFQINPGSAIISSITEHIHVTGHLNIPHAALALQSQNDKTDELAIFTLNQFSRSKDLAFLLFGNWIPKPDAYQYYRPAYRLDKTNTDLVTPKKIRSDKVRTIAMHVEGSPRYINQFLQLLDTEKLNRLIIQ